MKHPHWSLFIALVSIIAFVAIAAPAFAGELELGYLDADDDGVGIWPQYASANSARYFRVVALYDPDDEAIHSLTLSGGLSPSIQIVDPSGPDAGVNEGVVSSWDRSMEGRVFTVGPFAGRDIFGNPHQPAFGVLPTSAIHPPMAAQRATFRAVFRDLDDGDLEAVTVTTQPYNTYSDNSDYLQWYSGDAEGIDPISVYPEEITPDDGTGSSRFRFKVVFRNVYGLPPLTARHTYPPPTDPDDYGDLYEYVDYNPENPADPWYRRGEWWDDFWLYAPWDDHGYDRVGEERQYNYGEVMLIIDGDRTRPHFMHKEDPGNSNWQGGVTYFYDLLPTDYKRYIENVFMFPYDPAGPDDLDRYALNLLGRPQSNNYVALSAGGHTYEFIASDDFSPVGKTAWMQVGQPGNGLHNDYLRTRPYRVGITGRDAGTDRDDAISSREHTRFRDPDYTEGGSGYPYDSQNPDRYPKVDPVLSAHPYFPTGTIEPNATFTPDPTGSTASPFPPETGAGPNPPKRYTNDDTILPNFTNIYSETAANPFRGGKWTNQTKFTFRINYWQSDNTPPSFMRVFIRKATATEDGQWQGGSWQSYTMEQMDPNDTNYTDGCVFQFQATPRQLPDGGGPGDYNYYFQAGDGTRSTIYPNRPSAYEQPGGATVFDLGQYGVPQTEEGEDYYWFRVNRPPTLGEANVDPSAGNTGANFRYTINYTDNDGEVLNTEAGGDRPFDARIHIDLFGNPQGVATITAINTANSLEYDTPDGDGYDANELVGMQLRVLTGAAADQTYTITNNTGSSITLENTANLNAAGVAVNDTFRMEKWFQATMTQADPSDTDYTTEGNGGIFEFNTATNCELGPGTHRYYFEFTDDWGTWLYPDNKNVKVEGQTVRYPDSDFIEGPEVRENTPPLLKDFRFSPRSTDEEQPDGTTATSFVFFVTYVDLDNDPPSFIRLGLDGTPENPDRVLELTPDRPEDTVYTDGVTYKSEPIKLAAGEHTFYGQASDGKARYPAASPGDPLIYAGALGETPDDDADGYQDYVEGPTVADNTPPTLSFPENDDGTEADNPPGLDPNSGHEDTQFTYTVIYSDPDRFAGRAGNPPKYVRVYIDGEQHDMSPADPQDVDYTDGATFVLEGVRLAEGTPHTYFFLASDDLDTARLPKLGQEPNDRYEGPIVDEPPGAPMNLVAQDTPDDNGGSITLEFSASSDDGGGAQDVEEYRVYRTETQGTYTDTAVMIVEANESASYRVQDTSAVTDTPYYYIVRAWDGVAESADSNEEGPVRALDNIKPRPPSDINVTDPELGGTLRVTWSLSPDDGAGENDVTEYHIYRSTIEDEFSPPSVGTVPAGETEFMDTSVPHGTGETFYYTVRAFDGSNESDDPASADQWAQPTDNQAPEIIEQQPADGAQEVDLQPTISFAVEDTGAGVDQATIVLSINGEAVPQGDLQIEGDPARYEVSYTPAEPFDYRSRVRIRVDAADREADPNEGSAEWSFITKGRPTSAVSGTVRDADGAGVPDVVVTAGEITEKTNSAGEYTITGLAEGTYEVSAQLRGWHISPPQTAVTLPPDALGINFTAEPGFDISGTVVDEDGQPVSGARVAAGGTTDITDAQGEYTIIDLPKGSYQVVPSLEGHEFEPTATNVELGPAATGIDFTAKVERHSLSGQITTSTGERLENVTVTAENADTGETVDVQSGPSGQYMFSDLVRGTYTITPQISGYDFKPDSQDVELFAPKSDVNFVGIPLYGVSLAEGLSMVAVPIDPETTDFHAAFGNAGVARWDAATGQYITHADPDNPLLELAPGRGYFVRTDGSVTNYVAGTPVSTSIGFDLNLTQDWTMVGNPYPTALQWSRLGVASGGAVKDYGFIYDPAINDYRLVADVQGVGILNTIPNGAGFWMHSDTAKTVHINAPLATAEASEPAMTFGDGDYLIPLQASAGGTVDGCAAAGVAQNAAAMPDGGQIMNPPTIGADVDLYFVADDGRKLSYDVHSAGASSHTWEFEVQTAGDMPVTLSLPDLSAVPAEKQVNLIDTASDRRIYARTVQGYTYEASADQPRRFKLEVTDRTAAALVVSSATATMADGGHVTLSYALSQPASVSVNVMNISGRRIRTVAAGQARSAGVNTESWDLRNDHGSMVPTGRYMLCIRAQTDSGQQVQSIVPVQVKR
ncbi:MAG: carboxypeptidase regulatory-like domain-containing protein [Armatimonadota bacterium]